MYHPEKQYISNIFDCFVKWTSLCEVTTSGDGFDFMLSIGCDYFFMAFFKD